MEIKKVLFNFRVILLILFLLGSALAINPRPFNEGASIRSVEYNSSAAIAGIASPKPTATPLSREIILSVNGVSVSNALDYEKQILSIHSNDSVRIKTNKAVYSLIAKEKKGIVDIGLSVADAPTSNIRKGLDLQGGTRILLQPEEQISAEDLDSLILGLGQRLNVYGLSDLTVRPVSDLEGKKFILVEIAGATDQEIRELIAKQGKFEAKVGNVSVFKGGSDITYVCRSADCSGLSPYQASQQTAADQWSSTFQFSISLSKEAAQRMADETKKLTVIGQYLSEPISLYLDDQLVDSLQISSSLRGQAVTDISVSGPGLGRTQQESQLIALENMKKMQTVLVTGSLPVKLNIVKIDTISPALGTEFVHDAIVMLIVAILGVSAVIFLRYRTISIVVPIMITLVSEVFIILGFAALIGWNIDAAAIAGLLAAVGTGVDDQIVIMDETTSKEGRALNWLKRMKNAFFIIFAAYFAGLASMIPLLFAGAGLLKGFAITTMLGISIGVFVTRPAFAAIVEQLVREE
ncbi:MAG TPA: preprotein translocase subunit SecD [Candidatus Nanoarchaeia archaeon]|nr:preprotein translocase subunit SecD [Candidatus Nanoarchaeia archaeon]